MNIAMISAAVSLQQLQQRLDVMSNNIANINTTGYKRRDTYFQDLLTQHVRQQQDGTREVGRETPYGLRIGHGVKVTNPQLNMSQGNVRQTDRELDWMIEGEHGWFRVLKSTTDAEGNVQEEILQTRDGQFQIQPVQDQPGLVRILTAQGYPVLGEDDRLLDIPANYTSLSLSEGGLLTVHTEDGLVETIPLNIAYITRPGVLEAVGENHFRLTMPEDELIDAGSLSFLQDNEGQIPVRTRQGMLEQSNVDLAEQMSQVLMTQRLMQFQSRAIAISDDMMGLVNNIRT